MPWQQRGRGGGRSSRPVHHRRGRGLLLVGWVALYLRIDAPINRTLTTAADGHQLSANARALPRGWGRVIVARALVQVLTITALGVSLIS